MMFIFYVFISEDHFDIELATEEKQKLIRENSFISEFTDTVNCLVLCSIYDTKKLIFINQVRIFF